LCLNLIRGKLDSIFRVAVFRKTDDVIDGVREMNRSQAIKLLRRGPKGVAEWNQQRSSLEVIPTLIRADLSEANLSRANLSSANLSEAKLSRADLYTANLSLANLSLANLSRADLSEANLSRANLSGADLSGAVCDVTGFANLDLSEAIGLESVVHRGPSSLGIDTLFSSSGRIPEVFLRGCGVPEAVIEYLPSLIRSMSPIQFYSCFISYSSKDEGFVKHLHSRMRDEGLRVWFAPDDVQGGKHLADQIEQAIRLYDKLLIVLSTNSLSSEWVKTELRKALKAETKDTPRKLFPIRLVDFDIITNWEYIDPVTGKNLGFEIRKYFIPDFSDWTDHDSFESSFQRLLKDLQAVESTGVKRS
jgi:uncharacterized protein YjbI with pentapeptide repeats